MQLIINKEFKKNDFKAMFFTHQCIDKSIFRKLRMLLHHVWDILEKGQSDDSKLKSSVHILRRQIELLQMKPSQKGAEKLQQILSDQTRKQGDKHFLLRI